MKIKIIDLLNKKAKGEEAPKKIKYRDKIWEYTVTINGRGYQYYDEYFQAWKTLQNQVYLEECLNDKVEIIEEDKKLEKIDFRTLNTQKEKNRAMKDTINQLIDEINKLKENK